MLLVSEEETFHFLKMFRTLNQKKNCDGTTSIFSSWDSDSEAVFLLIVPWMDFFFWEVIFRMNQLFQWEHNDLPLSLKNNVIYYNWNVLKLLQFFLFFQHWRMHSFIAAYNVPYSHPAASMNVKRFYKFFSFISFYCLTLVHCEE